MGRRRKGPADSESSRAVAVCEKNVRMTTFPDSHKDLLDQPVAALTTVDAKGYPQTTLIWFVYDEGEIRISLNATRLKTKNLLRNPKVSLLIGDPTSPMRYLDVRGDAKPSPDPGLAFAHGPLKEKYDTDVSTRDKPGEERILVTLEPTNVYAVDMRS
jgi:PPOX class probable F420-dependent enzyme